MKRATKWLVAASAAGAAVSAPLVFRAEQAREERQLWGLFRTYCTECHNDDDLAGEVSFAKLTPASVPAHAQIFEAAVRKLRGHLMPPPGSPQPEPKHVDSLIASLERSIDDAAQRQRKAGYVPAQRLNRTEYANAVEDLLGVEIDAADYLPPSACRRRTSSNTSTPQARWRTSPSASLNPRLRPRSSRRRPRIKKAMSPACRLARAAA